MYDVLVSAGVVFREIVSEWLVFCFVVRGVFVEWVNILFQVVFFIYMFLFEGRKSVCSHVQFHPDV